jgi:hypothetical protein
MHSPPYRVRPAEADACNTGRFFNYDQVSVFKPDAQSQIRIRKRFNRVCGGCLLDGYTVSLAKRAPFCDQPSVDADHSLLDELLGLCATQTRHPLNEQQVQSNTRFELGDDKIQGSTSPECLNPSTSDAREIQSAHRLPSNASYPYPDRGLL